MTKKIVIILTFLVITKITLHSTTQPGWLCLQKNYAISETLLSSSFLEIGALQTILNNPSSLAYYKGKSGIFFSTELSTLNNNNSTIFYVNKLNSTGLAASIVYNDFGQETIQYIESGVEKSKEISLQKDILFNISISKLLKEKISFSTTLKLAYSTIQQDSAFAFGMDLNLLFLSFIKNSNISIAIKNLGVATEFKEEADSLPLSFLVSYSYLLNLKQYFIEMGINLPYVINYKLLPSLGLAFLKKPIKININYAFNKQDANLILGITGEVRNFDISYNVIPTSYIGVYHKISISYKF